MKKIYLFAFTLSFLFLNSCGDTTVVENLPDGNATTPPISGYFKKRVLIEDYTGTWCGNCTRVSYAIEQAVSQSDKVVSVAIHNGNDPYHFEGIAPLKNLILPNTQLALPVSRLNRMTVWTFPEPTNVQQAIDLTGNNSGLGLAIKSAVVNNNINVDIKMKFALNYTNLKLVVYVLEDGLINLQKNYTSYYNAVNPIPDYVHNHVLRTTLTNILGDTVEGNTEAGNVFTKSFSVPMPANIENIGNVNFVAFLVDENNNALNVRASHINENQSFEENQ
ncbi:Omp28-related outer membrane protein [Flavobacterium sp.]